MSTATGIYRAVMLECERRRASLGLPMEKFDEYAGLSERYYAKALHADAPSGRQAQWGTLQVIVDALFPAGFDLEIKPRPGLVITADNLKAKLLQLKAIKDPKAQRELMRELGRKGGQRSGVVRKDAAARRRRLREQGKRGAAIRWRSDEIIDMAEVRADLRGLDEAPLATRRECPK
jgi:hypothetical protein